MALLLRVRSPVCGSVSCLKWPDAQPKPETGQEQWYFLELLSDAPLWFEAIPKSGAVWLVTSSTSVFHVVAQAALLTTLPASTRSFTELLCLSVTTTKQMQTNHQTNTPKKPPLQQNRPAPCLCSPWLLLVSFAFFF